MGRRINAVFVLAGLCLARNAAADPPAPPPTTLYNSGDPTLALTPGLRGATVAPKGAAPANPDPHNLEGVWWLQGYQYLLGPEPGIAPPLKPEYLRILERRIRAKNRGAPRRMPPPHACPWDAAHYGKSLSHRDRPDPGGRIHFPAQEVAHNIRRIYLDQPHPENVALSFLGDSVGHWEGDTLVVDTVGLNDRTFIDDEGSSHSTREHVVERYTKIDHGEALELIMTIEDPVTLEHPYSYRRVFHWRPDVRPQEYVCEENNRNAPVNGVTVAK